MSLASIPLSYLYRRFVGKYKLEMEDPYFEEVEFEKRPFWGGSTKVVKRRREKVIPDYIPKKDKSVLRRLKKRAYGMDMAFGLCGMRFGWLGVLGMLPVVGDIAGVVMSLLTLREANGIQGGLPLSVMLTFLLNIVVDFVVGLIPLVGDMISIAYKANSRNVLVLERYLNQKYGKQHAD
ncbi:AaceriAEL101Cp [[Ashbya] aceris (nom. inval.)]|nr:AaceriAEL101Cp [[Ashbya] aceris (nom. inval.)]